jgi:NTP pyrophosphatase (non-canonical NTP hydrolase)
VAEPTTRQEIEQAAAQTLEDAHLTTDSTATSLARHLAAAGLLVDPERVVAVDAYRAVVAALKGKEAALEEIEAALGVKLATGEPYSRLAEVIRERLADPAQTTNATPSVMVREFHEAFGVAIDAEDTGRLRQLRNQLLHEEYSELRAEINRHPNAPGKGELTAVAKELADLVYVAYGTAVSLGIDLDKAVRRVHTSNMSKRNPDGTVTYRDDGKVLKPSTYQAPDLTDVVRAPTPVVPADQAFPGGKP